MEAPTVPNGSPSHSIQTPKKGQGHDGLRNIQD